ncbi:hypothetical protein [Paraburkholderia solisilvae]|uniref:Uncharacterized protein n=1 Tax=Paraburkholderia solisilvae TaxID=624376 RepID=A0A6J5DXU9_9BURK|nr:hypothetical protein [Paraburkholderia solisilvae]CAB3759090.1 hypothetical protein LMG29739_03108 [Paraburkholderia solisilvae]
MANSNSSLESEISKWLVELIQDESLPEAIGEVARIDAAIESFDQRVGIPAFGFDHLSRRANIRAAATVLNNLKLLDIVSVDKSISLTTGEVLRPDILCFNPESRTLIVFEIKRDKLTERQAITELAGYEQELRNAFPFLGDFDVNFVVVSTHWDTLLSHAISNFNTWSGKHCLALRVSADERPFTLTCHVPDAWQLRGGNGLPQEALQTIDVCLYEEGARDDGEEGEQIPAALITAINIIARSGDRHESHGFVMLWKDHANFGNGQWSLTLCGVDSFAMYEWCRRHGLPIRSSDLTEYLTQHASDMSSQAPSSIYRIAKDSFPVLRGKYRPMFETACAWDDKMSLLRRRASPIYFEFWGALGDYAREFVCHQAVRERYIPYIELHGLDWTHADVAFPLIGNICGDIPFPDGVVRCSDAFEAGIRLGLHEAIARISDESVDEEQKLAALMQWTLLEATRVAIEMAEIYRTVAEVDVPPPPLSSARSIRASSVSDLCTWVVDHLIGDDHPVHQQCFELGRWGAIYFSDWLDVQEQQTFVHAHADALADPLREMLESLFKITNPFDMEGARTSALRGFLRQVAVTSSSELDAQPSPFHGIPAVDLLSAFRDYGARGLDEIVPAVLHTTGEMPDMALDWDGIRESARRIFEGGCQWPAVLLSQNGRWGVGEVDEQYRKLLLPISDPDVEIYFVDQKAVASFSVKMTWPELREKLTLSPPATS